MDEPAVVWTKTATGTSLARGNGLGPGETKRSTSLPSTVTESLLKVAPAVVWRKLPPTSSAAPQGASQPSEASPFVSTKFALHATELHTAMDEHVLHTP